MQNAMNIMAMVQNNNVSKQKFDVPSKTLGNKALSFNKELTTARKELAKEMGYDIKADETQSQGTTENRLQRLAKVMSKNANAEVKEKPSAQVLEKLSIDDLKIVLEQAEAFKDTELPKEDEALSEAVQSVIEMLQQLMQGIKDSKAEDNPNLQTADIKDKLMDAIKKVEEALAIPISNPNVELRNILTQLKTELPDLANKLAKMPEAKENIKEIEQMVEPLLEKLNQVKTQMHQEVKKQSAEPGNTHKEIPKLTEETKAAAEGKDKEVLKTDYADSSAKQDESELNDAAVDKGKDKKMNNDSITQKEKANTSKNEANSEVKQAADLDKPNQNQNPNANNFQDIPVIKAEKPSLQLNIKQMDTYFNKDNLVTINSTDIINQVIKKADLIVQGSHQEMVMKLEPESLGKLNLKLVVENGLVTAKFVAESHQVKEVLESNFNQLKDALQDKGIAVQNFSVSVGQQGAEFKSGQGFDQWKRSIKLSRGTSGEYMDLDDGISTLANPYSYHEGKVDFRA